MRAANSEHVDLNDEMDHLGLYIAQNNYSKYAEEIKANQRLKQAQFRWILNPH